jgi:hypothetical protein
MRHFCILFDWNYLPRGLLLYHSVKKHSPAAQVHILCTDDASMSYLAQSPLPDCHLISPADIEAADPELLAIKGTRTLKEYCFTLKSCLIRHLLRRIPENEFLTYLDADLYFFSGMEPIYGELKDGSVGMMAHRFPKGLEHMAIHGIYNAGWIAFRNDDRGRRCLEHWRKQCFAWCHDRVEGGHYADQTYLNEWPGQFEGTVVVQNPGANLAPWNVGQYKIDESTPPVSVDGHALIFYHFHALYRIAGASFDSQLGKYGFALTDVLRNRIYQPYLDKLWACDRTVNPGTTPDSKYTLIPRHTGTANGTVDEHAAVENYLQDKLAAAEKDVFEKMAIILDLEKQCASRLEGMNYLKKVVAEKDEKIARYKNPIGYWLRGGKNKIKTKE